MLVIADDLTGAAEIGGVAHRFGLSAEVIFKCLPHPSERMVVVATDTRGLPPEQAAAQVASMVRRLKPAPGCKIYKKVDSVLRGPVVAEICALMEVLGRPRTLLLPCNPGSGRAIHSGGYWVDGRPIHETDFQRDPDHPARSSEIRELLRPPPGSPEVHVLPLAAELPASGIIVGEAASTEEMRAWAGRLDASTLPAGAAEFFAAILEREGRIPRPHYPSKPVYTGSALLVSGSAAARSREQIDSLEDCGLPILRMPQPLFDGDPAEQRLIRDWAEQVIDGLAMHGRAVTCIGRPVESYSGCPARLSRHLGELARMVLARFPVDHLWVEGGATASALAERMGWRRLEVNCELSPGVVQVKPFEQERPLILLKPGSYDWPAPL